MWEQQPFFNDIYIRHLIPLLGSYPIKVIDDIVSSDRRILLYAGEDVNEVRLNALIGRDLVQPIGMNIYVDVEYGANLLYQDLVEYFSRDDVLLELYNLNRADELLQRCCRFVCSFSHIGQYLWMMKHITPRIYDRGLFCAWMAAVMRGRKGGPLEQTMEAFMAGLVHDVGLLFVPEPNLQEHEELSIEDWQHIRRHPRAGYDLLSFIRHCPESVTRAVLEHHEELDGTGYPGQKVARQLAPVGQIIHLLDTTHAVYVKYFKPRRRTLNDLIPILQMNPQSAPGRPAAFLIVILRRCRSTENCSVPAELMPSLIHQVKDRHIYIKNFVEQAEIFVEENPLAVANARIFSLSRLLEHIGKAMHQSGLINDAYMRWLDQVEMHQLTHAYREVEDVFLMMQEVLYMIQRFTLRLSELIEESSTVTQLTPIWAPNKSISLIEGEANKSERDSAQKSLKEFERYKAPKLPSELSSLWLNEVRRLKNQ